MVKTKTRLILACLVSTSIAASGCSSTATVFGPNEDRHEKPAVFFQLNQAQQPGPVATQVQAEARQQSGERCGGLVKYECHPPPQVHAQQEEHEAFDRRQHIASETFTAFYPLLITVIVLLI